MKASPRWIAAAILTILTVPAPGLAVLDLIIGPYAVHVVLQRGAPYWTSVDRADSRLSASMRLALSGATLDVEAGSPTWTKVQEGFDVAELPVLRDHVEVDRIMLARVHTSRFRFIVRSDPAGNRQVDDWMGKLGAALVVNGSYYALSGAPDTPVIADGKALGPRDYQASHGAFVVRSDATLLEDLDAQPWQDALNGARDAMISYPLLVAPDGSSRTGPPSRWPANRSFVAEEAEGRIIVGTTKDAFFSLDRLSAFLRNAPLDI